MHRRHIEARLQRTLLRWMVARLDGDAVQFNERSRVDQSGKAKIVSDGTGVARSVFFELSEGELPRLVWFTGGYSRQTSEVACVAATARFSAETIVAKPEESDLPLELPLGRLYSIHDLHETLRTVGVSEKAIGQIYAMCISIRPLRDPALTIRRRFDLVSNESTHTTDREQRGLSPRSGRRPMSYLSEKGFISHALPPSFIVQSPRNRNAARC
jgi:hypothetical protein